MSAPHQLRHALAVVALAPVIPQVFGSIFNIWYNATVVIPLLDTAELRTRFVQTIVVYNTLAYPIAVWVWLKLVFSLKPAVERLRRGDAVGDAEMMRVRRRLIHLPFWGAAVSGAAWLLCIPVFLSSLALVGHGVHGMLLWHLPISFAVSAFISITHSFFMVELASHWGLYPVLFHDTRPDLMPGAHVLSLRGRGILWAISAGICPIGSLLMLSFAPPAPDANPEWFAVFVGTVGIAFGLCTAVLMGRLVAEPIDHLRAAAQAVARGELDVVVPMRRADEFGQLAGEFNRMIRELRDKERLRKTFGLHVGKRAAEQILRKDPGVGGVEQVITVMFVDIRSFTHRSAQGTPADIVRDLNEFLNVMVHVVEEQHDGMVNKFLGDGFIALFGIGSGEESTHAADAFAAATHMLAALPELNARLQADGRAPLHIGIGLHTGPAIVGSIGSPQRLEFTAIGSTVNLASRIEGLTKTLGYSLLLSGATRDFLDDAPRAVSFGGQAVRGVEEPVEIWGVAREPEPVSRRA